jgi:2-phosphosulfolactate phosphatase
VHPAHRQSDHALRHDRGGQGAAALAAGTDVAVVVDVLSFITTLSVAADGGTVVYPYRWTDNTAGRFARDGQTGQMGRRLVGLITHSMPAARAHSTGRRNTSGGR